jgi:hypothetical protein
MGTSILPNANAIAIPAIERLLSGEAAGDRFRKNCPVNWPGGNTQGVEHAAWIFAGRAIDLHTGSGNAADGPCGL